MLAAALKFMDGLSQALPAVLLGIVTCIVGIDFLSVTDTTFAAVYPIAIGFAASFLEPAPGFGFALVSSLQGVTGDFSGAHYFSARIPARTVAIGLAVFLVGVALRTLYRELEKRALARAGRQTAEIAATERLEREPRNISERVQRRVGHDIHDGVCQHLTDTALAGQVLAEKLKARGSPKARDANRVVESIKEGLTLWRNCPEGLNSVRRSTEGLMESLDDFAASTSERFKPCRVECPPAVVIGETRLDRIAPEAAGNAIKHGQAENILIRLETSLGKSPARE
jgi:signal transduction histidine kinase